MITINFTNDQQNEDFNIVKLIDDNDTYFADIKIKSDTKRIKLIPQDYYRILVAIENNQKLKILPYPIQRGYVLEIVSEENNLTNADSSTKDISF